MAHASERVPTVTVCIATYRRPRMLAALLESVRQLETPPQQCRLSGVIVVDNDADRSAEPYVTGLAGDFPVPIRYHVEPERNISLARNRAVDAALASETDYVAFVDDDEIVPAAWLSELMRVAREYGADVVTGPLAPRFEAGTPAWIADPRLFGNAPMPTGRVIDVAATNNVLMSSHVLRLVEGPFERAFGRAGGGDSLFFRLAHRRGARIVWAQEAAVTETVPLTRATPRWLLRRAFRRGNCGVFVMRAVQPLPQWLGGRLAKAMGHMLFGVVTLVPAALRGRTAILHSVLNVAFAAGMLAAFAGFRFEEYHDVHGS